MLSKGKEVLEFPDVKNISKENALYKIQSAGFKGGKDTYDTVHSSTIPAGLVVDQDPAPQASWFKNKDFKLTISDGPEVITISMPNVLGKTSADAKSLLEQNKLKVILDSQESNVYPKDVVISSKPEPDASVQQWTEVTLVVSGGPGPTPKQLSQNDILVSLLQLVPNDGKSHDVRLKSMITVAGLKFGISHIELERHPTSPKTFVIILWLQCRSLWMEQFNLKINLLNRKRGKE
ncbi:MAG: PASTA domain-containing protein [Desulfitobacteriaceae bacterium]